MIDFHLIEYAQRLASGDVGSAMQLVERLRPAARHIVSRAVQLRRSDALERLVERVLRHLAQRLRDADSVDLARLDYFILHTLRESALDLWHRSESAVALYPVSLKCRPGHADIGQSTDSHAGLSSQKKDQRCGSAVACSTPLDE